MLAKAARHIARARHKCEVWKSLAADVHDGEQMLDTLLERLTYFLLVTKVGIINERIET